MILLAKKIGDPKVIWKVAGKSWQVEALYNEKLIELNGSFNSMIGSKKWWRNKFC